MATEGERIARLEALQENDEKAQQALATRVEQIDEKVDKLVESLNALEKKLCGWRGFFGGVTVTISALSGLIGAGLVTAIKSLWQSLTGGGGAN